MKLTDILHSSCVVTQLAASNKVEAISALVDVLAENDQISDADAVRKAVLEREATKSTAMGYGMALPHGKSRGCARPTMAIGCAREPIDFDSQDGQPVDLIVLLASPLDQVGPHLQAIAKISRLMLSETFRKRLAQAETPDIAYQLIVEFE